MHKVCFLPAQLSFYEIASIKCDCLGNFLAFLVPALGQILKDADLCTENSQISIPELATSLIGGEKYKHKWDNEIFESGGSAFLSPKGKSPWKFLMTCSRAKEEQDVMRKILRFLFFF